MVTVYTIKVAGENNIPVAVGPLLAGTELSTYQMEDTRHPAALAEDRYGVLLRACPDHRSKPGAYLRDVR